ncbi:hypothetical protein HS99_0029065 [Kitasatospora aureofaciens]|uniref:Uncharacterized protein n=2 Tax=Kitasatospora aureofaciens TaxID=1894 RepID=A0A1E7N795_KITAU|nr:hypothetical protein B6264_09520 [Kitasatospora aureofaciens]OEV36572.1 hypothetical protein HS99_0029065 [Kitasatospora aureofaciens]QEV00327.1 hypothetical protein CP971_14475 [Streptomyces viridifaciens]GGU82550.1 hypothetical protein GCM10010502_38150 [Kitasatospora aureofaciens]
MNRYPMKPTDPRIRAYTDDHIRTLLAELHERGRKFGLLFPSADIDHTLDGRVLVRFNTAPASTLLNLLTLLLDADRERPCDS